MTQPDKDTSKPPVTDEAALREVKPQDADSGLVAREWRRTSRKRGQLTERTMEGEQVFARFLDRSGSLSAAKGIVGRDEAGTLVVECWVDGVKRQTAVPRHASVEKSR